MVVVVPACCGWVSWARSFTTSPQSLRPARASRGATSSRCSSSSGLRAVVVVVVAFITPAVNAAAATPPEAVERSGQLAAECGRDGARVRGGGPLPYSRRFFPADMLGSVMGQRAPCLCPLQRIPLLFNYSSIFDSLATDGEVTSYDVDIIRG